MSNPRSGWCKHIGRSTKFNLLACLHSSAITTTSLLQPSIAVCSSYSAGGMSGEWHSSTTQSATMLSKNWEPCLYFHMGKICVAIVALLLKCLAMQKCKNHNGLGRFLRWNYSLERGPTKHQNEQRNEPKWLFQCEFSVNRMLTKLMF